MKNFKRVICIIGVVFLISLYVLSFVSAVFYSSGFEHIFKAAIYSTFVIPVLLYGILLIYKVLNNINKQ